MGTRRRISAEIEAEVLIRSKRRCCLCFGLGNDCGEKKGQIAHIDKNRENNSEDNLVFLCFEHHDQYDSTTSQSKNITSKEIKHYRHILYAYFQVQAAESVKAKEIPLVTENDVKEALVFHTGTHRSQSAVLSLRHSSMTMSQINEEIPPFDKEWTETIVNGVINYGWVRENPISPGIYEITSNGKRMLSVLELVPEEEKVAAWKAIWMPNEEDQS